MRNKKARRGDSDGFRHWRTNSSLIGSSMRVTGLRLLRDSRRSRLGRLLVMARGFSRCGTSGERLEYRDTVSDRTELRMCRVSEFQIRIRPHSASQLFFDDVHEPGSTMVSRVEDLIVRSQDGSSVERVGLPSGRAMMAAESKQ